MALTGYIKSLFSDKEKTSPLFPITKTKAVIDDEGKSLDELLGDAIFVDDGTEEATGYVNADTLGGKDISYFAQKSDIKPKAGFIYPLATPNVPDGFLLCDGKAYSRTEYVELFAAIGTYYGDGDGSTTFNVPNLQTRVPVGAGGGYELGSIGGEATHTLIQAEIPNYKIGFIPSAVPGYHGEWENEGVYSGDVTTGNRQDTVSDTSTGVSTTQYGWNVYTNGGDQPHNNMQPYTVINYIISTGKDNSVYIRDVITGAQVMPLEVQYGGTGALNADDARKNLGIREYKRNLLDNSDFRNPVNQRGATSCTSAWSYFIDRWVAENATVTIGDAGVAITDGYLTQRVPKDKINANSVYTLAACDEDGIIYVGSNAGDVLGVEDTSYDFVTVKLKNGRTYRWAALYEGEYTTETLPYYVPKGYGAELLECQMYYRQSNGFTGRLIVDNVWSGAGERFEIPMRAIPTVSIYSINNVKSAVSTWGLSDDVSANASNVTQNGFDIWSDQKFITGRRYFYRYTASADL